MNCRYLEHSSNQLLIIFCKYLFVCMQFLYETPVASSVDDTVQELVKIWNLQIQVIAPNSCRKILT